MKTKHTKGEWNVTESGLELMIETDSTAIAEVYTSSKEFEANAKLIAAAPDLLEALYAAKLSLKELAKTAYEHTSLAAQIEAAIKKATE